MNKKELKQLMKPIVKECIQEALLEEGMLSTIISEVVKGTSGLVVEQQAPPKQPQRYESDNQARDRRTRLKEQRSKLNAAIGVEAYGGVDLFEGTKPLGKGGDPNGGTSPQSALSGYAPDDSGVDITSLVNLGANTWKKLK